MYKLYVLKSLLAEKSYVGITVDLERRLNKHNSGRTTYTKRYLPWKVVYTEDVANLNEARKREKYMKSAAGRKFLRNFVFKD